jgi:salicylate hydroxylase
MQQSNVAVIGAGIGGLAAALALLRAGQRVRVFELVETLGEVGAGLSITPNAGKALRALGVLDQLERIGSRPPAGAIRHYATGERLVALPQDQSETRYGIPLFHVHRADLHSALRAAILELDPDCLRTGAGVDQVQNLADEVSFTLRDGSTHRADWLVGADGIHSRTRQQIFGEDQPNFTGYVAWRGLIPGEQVPPSLLDPPLCMTVGPRRMLMRYPLRKGAWINFVAVAKRSAWVEEGWSVRSTLDELLSEFADFEEHTLALLRLTSADRLFKWGLFDRDPLPTWTQGRVTLLGDAAHAMPPFTGQGAVMALEDAAILGRAAAIAGDPAEALRRYEQARLARVTHALQMSRSRAALYFADEPAAQVQALAAGMAELRMLYDYDAKEVPI